MGRSLHNTMEAERIITLTSPELGKILMEHKDIAMQINTLSKEVEAKDKERQALLVDLQKFNDKIKTLVEELTQGQLEKYEVLMDANTDKDDSDIIEVKVVDRLKFAQAELDKAIAEAELIPSPKEFTESLASDSE